MAVNNFTVIESVYGKFIVNRHCSFQAEALIKTGFPHIQTELSNILAVISILPEQSVVLDAGANIGLVSVPIAQALTARGGIVHAFEVQRMLFYALCGSAALNDLENLIAHNQGLGAAKRTLPLSRPDYSAPQDFGQFSLLKQGQERLEQIQIITIDSLALPRLDFLKIDVEGMDVEVLKGARRTLKQYQPWCWIEYWKVDVEEIKAQFAGLNYRFFLMDDLNMLCAPTDKLSASSLNVAAREI